MNVSHMLELMSDEYILRILNITKNRPLTISDISRDLGIPIASCYRRIEDLIEEDMIRVRDHLTDRGRKTKGYVSTVKRMDIKYDVVDIRIDITNLDGTKRSLVMDLNLEISKERDGVLPEKMPVLTIPDVPRLLKPDIDDTHFKPDIPAFDGRFADTLK
ncbi:MAG: winged helix-turn-helix transcriptional regulator [Thermoplasmatota archaeon]